MKKLTPKQEKFAQVYVECGNASEAYRQAYNAKNMKQNTIGRKAAELLENGYVTAKVQELRTEHKERHNVTMDSIIAELQEARAMAIELQNPSAATQATMGKAKVTGLLEDKVRITSTEFAIVDLEGRYEKG